MTGGNAARDQIRDPHPTRAHAGDRPITATKTAPIYDTIGRGYDALRREDPRIADAIGAGLAGARSVVNVGAGAGSYEPAGRRVVAVEPSQVMIRQRATHRAPVVRATAEAIPFADDSFDAALAVLTVHHWPGLATGLSELRRVARDRVVLLTFDPNASAFWLFDYFPEMVEIDRKAMPTLSMLKERLGPIDIHPVPVPHDCTDGFLGAYWRRPHAYLDADLRNPISIFTKVRALETGLEALQRDLDTGQWQHRHEALLEEPSLDLGYRLVVASLERA